jgi:integrase
MFKRARYQFGYLRRKPCKRKPDVWAWERNSSGPDGRRKRETVIVGTVAQYPTEAQAWRAAESFRLAVCSEEQNEKILFGALVDRSVREKLPKRHSTASTYRSWITHHVKPKWEGVPIRKVKPLLVEEWLMSLDLAPKSKGHVRSIMHSLFNWAMNWEFVDIERMNPMSLVRVEGSSKRLRQPRILSVKEFRALLDQLKEPIRTMCIVAACLGLRARELVGLQWATSIGKLLKSIFNEGSSAVAWMK